MRSWRFSSFTAISGCGVSWSRRLAVLRLETPRPRNSETALSLPLEICLPLLDARRQPFFCVLAGAEEAEQRRLEELSLLERHLATAHDRLDGRADGQRAARHDLARHRLRLGHELI